MFERKHRSPYRNFIRSETDPNDQVLYLMFLDTRERVEQLSKSLQSEPWAGEYRVMVETSEFTPYVRMKVYDAAVSKEGMLRVLEEQLGTAKTVTMGSVEGKYDVLIDNADRDQVVRELKRRFEPVDLRGWKNILRL